jgi:hypothetical protein
MPPLIDWMASDFCACRIVAHAQNQRKSIAKAKQKQSKSKAKAE